MKRIFSLFLIVISCLTVKAQLTWNAYLDSSSKNRSARQPEKAIDFLLKAIAVFPKDSLQSQTYVQSQKMIGDLYYISLQDPEAAIPFYEDARSVLLKNDRQLSKEYADLCNSLGTIYTINGGLDSAETLQIQAKNIRLTLFGDKSASYAQSCNNLGSLYRSKGDYESAEGLLVIAKGIREQLPPAGKQPVYAITCTGLANLYRDMGKYKDAEQLYLLARKVRADTFSVNHPVYAESCNILADLYYYMERYHEAEPLYLEAKNIREKIGKTTHAYGESCNNLASLYRNMQRFSEAEKLALETKAIYEKILPEDHPSRTINLNNIAELYYAMGKYAESEAYFLLARKDWETRLGKGHPYFISNSDELARLYQRNNRAGKANEIISEVSGLKFKQLRKVFQFTSENEQQLYLQNINGSADEYHTFYFKDHPHDKAGTAFDISLANRSLILNTIRQTREAIYTSGDPALEGSFQQWAFTRQQLARLYSRGAQGDTFQIKKLEDRAGAFEKKLAKGSKAFRKMQDPISWQTIRKELAPGEAAIEYASFRVFNNDLVTDSIYYVALLIRKEWDEPRLIPLFEEKQLDSIFKMRAPSNAAKIDLHYSQRRLYELVWQPAEPYLGGVTKIYFAPAGKLHAIAIAALPVNDQQVLLDKYKLVQYLTTASITDKEERRVNSKDKILLYGAVQYDADSGSMRQAAMRYSNQSNVSRALPENFKDLDEFGYFRPLPNSEAEINFIARTAAVHNIPTQMFSGAEANEESLKSFNNEPGSFVLHVSTHGFFIPQPKISPSGDQNLGQVLAGSANPMLRTGLILAGAENTWRGRQFPDVEDGVLTGYEISNLYFPKNKLVVLSACETGLGDVQGDEGVFGLQRSFKMAGAEQVLMSLWSVDDQKTSEFMQLFYKNLLNNQTISGAFAITQNFMKNKYRRQPYLWAAWVLVK